MNGSKSGSSSRAAKDKIASIFRDVGTPHEFAYFMLGMGFKRAKDGIRKRVFISPRHNFVVKIARDGDFYEPSKSSRIGRFYLWPEKVRARKFHRSRWHLEFQPKAIIRNQPKIFRLLEEQLFRANTSWRYDAHEGNVALYRGRPVIIDY